MHVPNCWIASNKVNILITFIYHVTNSSMKSCWLGIRSSVVGIVNRLRAGPSVVRIALRAIDLSLLHNVQTASGAHTASCSMGTGVIFLR